MNKNDLRYIKEYIKDLKLGGISSVLKEKLEEAYRTDMSYEGFLKDLSLSTFPGHYFVTVF